ncbi:MAG: WecB/TagA/CpsF family glycosyltransferase [Mycobacteriales bacterium]
MGEKAQRRAGPGGESAARPAPTQGLGRQSRVRLRGVGFDSLTEDEVSEHVVTSAAAGVGGTVVTPNIDILRLASRDDDLRRLVDGSSLVVADGVPLLWAARLAGEALAGQVAGSSLIFSLSQAAARRGVSIFLLGGAPGVAEKAGAALQVKYPGLRVAGVNCPPLGFESDPALIDAVRAAVTAAGPGIVFCGLGFPKQERLAAALAPAVPGTWFIGCGAAITFAAGQIPRAPRWMQRSGLEWVHRLSREPRRLFRRYIVDDLPFAVLLLARSWRSGRARRTGGNA